MRRQNKKATGTAKVLTAAAVAAALSTGSLTAFAAANDEVRVYLDGEVRTFTVNQLSDDYYRNLVMGAFNAAAPIVVQQADGTWNEISAAASAAGIADADVGYDITDPDSPFFVYGE